MGRNRPERQSGRVLAVKLGVVLVGLVILLALGYAGGRYLEKRRYTETRGELKDGFGEVPTVEIDGVTYEQKMNVTSLLMIGTGLFPYSHTNPGLNVTVVFILMLAVCWITRTRPFTSCRSTAIQ